MINGFGDAKAIEAVRTGIEKEFGVKAFTTAPICRKAPRPRR